MIRQPCPIPRCSLEWFLAVQLVMLAMFVGWFASDSPALHSLSFGMPVHHGRMVWAVLLVIPACAQIAGLLTDRRLFHRWAALLAGLTMAVFTLAAWRGDFVPVLAGLCAAHAIAELWVFAMLRGARWSS